MAYELTMEGLFSYFSPRVVEKIIKLPLIRRHLSVHDYFLCLDECASVSKAEEGPFGFLIDPAQRILGLDVLKASAVEEVLQYLAIPEVAQAYRDYYHLHFADFLASLHLAKKEQPLRLASQEFILNPVTEKKLILLIQAGLATPFHEFTHAIIEQDQLLRAISTQLSYQAHQAQQFIAQVEEEDVKYKQAIISIAFSVIRMGLGVFHVSELTNISQSLAQLASSSFDKIESKLSSIVSEIQNLVIYAHINVLHDAEKELLSIPAPEDIALSWSNYRMNIFDNANDAIKRILDTCVRTDDFFRCIIRETLYQQGEMTEDLLLVRATEKARLYVVDIANSLHSQVARIRHIHNAISSAAGMRKIEEYFRKICLINYTVNHERPMGSSPGWLTKKLGHRLSFYFPDVVFQEKWFPVTIGSLFSHGVKYCKETIPLEKYRERKRQASVVLGLFRNSPEVKRKLFRNLQEQGSHLSDDLIRGLQKQQSAAEVPMFLQSENYDSTRVRHYSFSRRQLSLFSFDEPQALDLLPKSVVLIGSRKRSDASAESI